MPQPKWSIPHQQACEQGNKDGERYGYAWREEHVLAWSFLLIFQGREVLQRPLMLPDGYVLRVHWQAPAELVPLRCGLQPLGMHIEDLCLVSPPSKNLNVVWNTTHLICLIMTNTSGTITVPFFGWGMGNREVKEIVQWHTASKDRAGFKPRQYNSKVHILNICAASHNFPLTQPLSPFPFIALPLPCFKEKKKQGCPRSELCLFSIVTHHSPHFCKAMFVFGSQILHHLYVS